jgi:hypothetical protein
MLPRKNFPISTENNNIFGQAGESILLNLGKPLKRNFPKTWKTAHKFIKIFRNIKSFRNVFSLTA